MYFKLTLTISRLLFLPLKGTNLYSLGTAWQCYKRLSRLERVLVADRGIKIVCFFFYICQSGSGHTYTVLLVICPFVRSFVFIILSGL